jgi:hypothetical protein
MKREEKGWRVDGKAAGDYSSAWQMEGAPTPYQTRRAVRAVTGPLDPSTFSMALPRKYAQLDRRGRLNMKPPALGWLRNTVHRQECSQILQHAVARHKKTRLGHRPIGYSSRSGEGSARTDLFIGRFDSSRNCLQKHYPLSFFAWAVPGPSDQRGMAWHSSVEAS